MYYRHLTVGCFNPNSVYNREESIQSTMEQYKISLMFLTEPMLRNNVDTAVTLPSIVKVDTIPVGTWPHVHCPSIMDALADNP